MKAKIYFSICFILFLSIKGFSQTGLLTENTSDTITLPGGNYIIKDILYDEGALTDIGIVRLYDGITNNVISTLKGSTSGDKVGNGGIYVMNDANFIVSTIENSGGYWMASKGILTYIKNGVNQNLTLDSNNSINIVYTEFSIINLNNNNFVINISNHSDYCVRGCIANSIELVNTGVPANNINGTNVKIISVAYQTTQHVQSGPFSTVDSFSNSNVFVFTSFWGERSVNLYDGNTGNLLGSFASNNEYNYNTDRNYIYFEYSKRCIENVKKIDENIYKVTYVSCRIGFPPIRLNATTAQNPVIDVIASSSLAKSGAEPFLLVDSAGTNPIEQKQYTAKVWLNEANAFMVNDKYYVSRHFEISPIAITPAITAKVKLYFTQGEFDNFNSLSGTLLKLPTSPNDSIGKHNLQIVKYAGTSNTNYGLPTSYGSTHEIINPDDAQIVWNGTMWEVGFNVTGFSGFFVSTSFIEPLPLKLENFAVKNTGLQNELNWQTVNESNTQSFQIERSTDAQKFENIGLVLANNKKELNNYQFIDNDISSKSTYYYRLKMNDIDGKNTFSKIISITNTNQLFTITPNPVIDKLTVNFGEHEKYLNSNCKLINSIGQSIKELKIIKLQLEVDLNGLPAGIYYLVLNDGNKVKFLKK